jgi:5'-deoxynucleotidase YfbR-like HD superfamily hydrolase
MGVMWSSLRVPVAGVRDPESIADRSFRRAIITSVITALEGGNPERAAFLSRWRRWRASGR